MIYFYWISTPLLSLKFKLVWRIFWIKVPCSFSISCCNESYWIFSVLLCFIVIPRKLAEVPLAYFILPSWAVKTVALDAEELQLLAYSSWLEAEVIILWFIYYSMPPPCWVSIWLCRLDSYFLCDLNIFWAPYIKSDTLLRCFDFLAVCLTLIHWLLILL